MSIFSLQLTCFLKGIGELEEIGKGMGEMKINLKNIKI